MIGGVIQTPQTETGKVNYHVAKNDQVVSIEGSQIEEALIQVLLQAYV